jgi:hypothetical protein
VDGGPHTLWWSIQDPSGTSPMAVEDLNHDPRQKHANFEHKFAKHHSLHFGHDDDDHQQQLQHGGGGGREVSPAPIHYLVYLLQPQAKLVITLAEPVRRMYSDYYFLTKSGVAVGTTDEMKSADDFHTIASDQVSLMHRCFVEQSQGWRERESEFACIDALVFGVCVFCFVLLFIYYIVVCVCEYFRTCISKKFEELFKNILCLSIMSTL